MVNFIQERDLSSDNVETVGKPNFVQEGLNFEQKYPQIILKFNFPRKSTNDGYTKNPQMLPCCFSAVPGGVASRLMTEPCGIEVGKAVSGK